MTYANQSMLVLLNKMLSIAGTKGNIRESILPVYIETFAENIKFLQKHIYIKG